jgi:hypothetical protein
LAFSFAKNERLGKRLSAHGVPGILPLSMPTTPSVKLTKAGGIKAWHKTARSGVGQVESRRVRDRRRSCAAPVVLIQFDNQDVDSEQKADRGEHKKSGAILDRILQVSPVTVLKKPLKVEQLNQTVKILVHNGPSWRAVQQNLKPLAGL